MRDETQIHELEKDLAASQQALREAHEELGFLKCEFRQVAEL